MAADQLQSVGISGGGEGSGGGGSNKSGNLETKIGRIAVNLPVKELRLAKLDVKLWFFEPRGNYSFMSLRLSF